ncbi:hypothetical protein ACIBCT_00255 [Streptosporangium sp. NPDC050855]|uniref:hypothetical protein n=1 Tax=Streptosporangium sp. NPDC050855 TaxID=3366194 RepID=UPI00378D9926
MKRPSPGRGVLPGLPGSTAPAEDPAENPSDGFLEGLPGLFADDPMSAPLTYPGRLAPAAGLLVDDRFLPMTEPPGALADRRVRSGDRTARLADHLAALGAAPPEARHPVIAVGSNAAPGQLRRKFTAAGIRPVVPLTPAAVHGVAPGVSAHISRYAYLPATPIGARGASLLFVVWVDDPQLAVLDATEPNYRRVPLPAGSFPVTLASGETLPPCHVYVSRHGCLVDEEGGPLPLAPQRELIGHLLGRSAALRRLCGRTPEEFVLSARDDGTREAARALFVSDGLADPAPPGLHHPRTAGSPAVRLHEHNPNRGSDGL